MSREADLSLVMETPPPEHSHIRTEGLHNNRGNRFAEWLAADQGFTLIRRERMLMCLSLKDGLPDGAIPRVTPRSSQRGTI